MTTKKTTSSRATSSGKRTPVVYRSLYDQWPGPAVDPRPQPELERQVDEQAPRHEQEVLVAVVHGRPSRRLGVGAELGGRGQLGPQAGGPGARVGAECVEQRHLFGAPR